MKLKINRILFTMFCGLFFLSQGISAVSPNPFQDVNKEDWFYDAVIYASSEELFFGTEKNLFSPYLPISRGMFVTVLGRLEMKSPVLWNGYSESYFTDVPAHAYYTKYVEWAYQNGIVNGVGNQKFAPDAPIKREEVAAMIYRYAKYIKMDTTSKEDSFLKFNDTNNVSSYAKDALQWCSDRGIINGIHGNLEPQSITLRSQSAQMMYKFAKEKPDHPGTEGTLFKLNPSAVKTITLFSGNNGNTFETTDPKQIAEVIRHLNNFRYDCITDQEPADGWSYRIEITSIMEEMPINLIFCNTKEIIMNEKIFTSVNDADLQMLFDFMEKALHERYDAASH